MTNRIIKHEAVPQTGSFEVRFPDGASNIRANTDQSHTLEPAVHKWIVVRRAMSPMRTA